MRYAEIMEARFEPQAFGHITSGPEFYIHYAHTPAQIRSILQKGFDLKKFGYTAKKFNMHDLAANDPRGVFALEYTKGDRVADRPYVIFTLYPRPNVLTNDGKHPGYATDLKSELATQHKVTGTKLTTLLLKSDIQVLHSTSEFIILDPSRIKIVRSSLDTEV